MSSSDWPNTSFSDELRQLQPSDVETLLVSGNMDYNNAPSFDEELPRSLSNGQHVVLSEFGHTGDFWKNQLEARLDMLTTFTTPVRWTTRSTPTSRWVFR